MASYPCPKCGGKTKVSDGSEGPKGHYNGDTCEYERYRVCVVCGCEFCTGEVVKQIFMAIENPCG